MSDYQSLLRDLPKIDLMMQEPALQEALLSCPRNLVLQSVQEVIDDYRQRIISAMKSSEDIKGINLSIDYLAKEAAAIALKRCSPQLRPVINATGIIIHTNLGRAPLAKSAVDALTSVAESYSNLEMNLESGKRGSRQAHLEKILCDLSGAEAAYVVNNNAAAVLLVLSTFAPGREVVVSRGELVEIGGSFRIPEIIAAGGARLVEVGTTNKTYLRDYEAAVNDQTSAFLKVHTSNYHLIGFTAAVKTEELVSLAEKHDVLIIEDLGSGVFLDLGKYDLPGEPRVQDSIAAGADLVTFSGDKMLGGPQAGIIVGREKFVSSIRRNQLARALRIDKFTAAALEATLKLYYDEEKVLQEIPVWAMLTADRAVLEQRANKLSERFAGIFDEADISVISGTSRVGGGALPMAELPTHLVAVTPNTGSISPQRLVEKLRQSKPPVVLRLQHDTLLFDPRTILLEQEEMLLSSLEEALKSF